MDRPDSGGLMSNLVIVAIPDDNDLVWKVSSEKKPHVTLLFLGNGSNPDKGKIAEFMLHAADRCLNRFYLDVDRRGELGPDKADVLFFQDMWDLPILKQFRGQLLQNDIIRASYEAVDQYPEWQPHLTLGYPKAPAHDDAVDYPITNVCFDRIALWDQDYEGVQIILKRYQYDMEVMMSANDARARLGLDFLTHHGVKGMKWGVRKDRLPTSATVEQKGKKLKAKGGTAQPAHPDAVRAKSLHQTAKKSGLHALSNEELRALQERMNLEQNVSNLSAKQPKYGPKVKTQSATKKFIADLLVNNGKQQLSRVAQQQATKKVDVLMAKERKKT
jgi:2'-5' RNA ligase